MGLFSWLFAGSNTQTRLPAARLPGPGLFGVDVVGESQYQDALLSICGGKTKDGVKQHCDAVLVHEDTNSYDKNAVRVEVQGHTVGYLSREDALQYRSALSKAGHAGITATCAALITGGWRRSKESEGSFGVKLDLPTS